MNKVYDPGMSGTSGPIKIPARPATAPLMAQFANAMFSGESPVTRAPNSDSADARVASPKRVKR